MDTYLEAPSVRVLFLDDAYVQQDCKGVTVFGEPGRRYDSMGVTDITRAAARIGEGGVHQFAGVTRVVLMERDQHGDITYVDSDGDYQTIKRHQVGEVTIIKP